jgi:hypothetical protein
MPPSMSTAKRTIGDELEHETLAAAIRWEAEAAVEHIPARLFDLVGFQTLVDLLVGEMTAALRHVADGYHALDGVV